MMQLLATLPAPIMTAQERRSLRQAVDEELTASTVVTMPVRTSRWDWTRLGTVAAALMGVVVIGGIVTSLGNNTAEQMDTVAAGSSDRAVEESPEMAAADTADGAETGDIAAAEAAEDEGIASLAARPQLMVDLGAVDASTFAAEIQTVSERIPSADQADAGEPLDLDLATGCLDELESEVPPLGILTAEVDGTSVVVYFDTEGTTSGFTTPNCAPYPLP